jgi:hypothetical protein
MTYVQIHLGRDLVPISVPSTLPVPPKAYLAYRSSIPNLVAIIERKEKTTTPPFAAQVRDCLCGPLDARLRRFDRDFRQPLAPMSSRPQGPAMRPLSVAFSLTSKLNRFAEAVFLLALAFIFFGSASLLP